jgi:hypothetical protein
MKLIETKTLTATAATIEFASIPQTFTDLVFLFSGRDTDAFVNSGLTLQVNSTFSGHTWRDLYGDGSAVFTSNGVNQGAARIAIPGSSATSNTFGSVKVYVPNYTDSRIKSFFADVSVENNATVNWNQIISATFNSTAAITNFKFIGVTLAIGSTVSLYGITKGSDGITTAS